MEMSAAAYPKCQNKANRKRYIANVSCLRAKIVASAVTVFFIQAKYLVPSIDQMISSLLEQKFHHFNGACSCCFMKNCHSSFASTFFRHSTCI